MRYNQWLSREGEVEYGEYTVQYVVMWVRDAVRDIVQLDGIEKVTVLDTNGEEVPGYYQEHGQEIDDVILEDAQKTRPDEWETPSWTDILEAKAEGEKYE